MTKKELEEFVEKKKRESLENLKKKGTKKAGVTLFNYYLKQKELIPEDNTAKNESILARLRKKCLSNEIDFNEFIEDYILNTKKYHSFPDDYPTINKLGYNSSKFMSMFSKKETKKEKGGMVKWSF